MEGLDSFKNRLRNWVGAKPRLFYLLLRFTKPEGLDVAVTGNTHIVIEGFPRSANTFAKNAFEISQKQHYRIAHHLHVPAQIIRAVELGIPTILLIRKPVDAVLSLVIRHPELSLQDALQYYSSFYETTFAFIDDVVIGHFEDVTSDFGSVIQRVNQKYETDFRPFEHNEENLKKVFLRIEEVNRTLGEGLESQVARPSAYKESQKEMLRIKLENGRVQVHLRKANEIYQSYLAG